MSNSYLSEALLYLVNTFFSIYILLVVLRFLLQTVGADAHNPVSQFLLAATNPPLRSLRRVIPRLGGIDWPCIVLAVLLKVVENVLAGLLVSGAFIALGGLLVLSIAALLRLVIHVFMFVILAQVIISWLSPGSYNPVIVMLHDLAAPLLRPVRRILPPAHGFDFSPVLALVLLQLSQILLVRPLFDLGRTLAG